MVALTLHTAVLLLALAPALLLAAVSEDEVKSLPGWSGSLPTRQYSGYISVDDTNGRYLHYWFVESAQDPSTDPVVVWMNGGPGCSSLDGYFYEQGPLHVGENWENETVPTLVANPYAWNKVANMLFLEAPAGVGFSYSKTASDYNVNDNKTADDNFVFLQNWFKAYPEYAKNDFYLTGESYAGIYVPSLAWNILTKDNSINMKGFMVGNGCIGNSVGVCSAERYKYAIEFYHGHALYSEKMYNAVSAACSGSMFNISKCMRLYGNILETVGPGNIYNIYDDCVDTGQTKELRLRVKTKDSGQQVGPAECDDGGAAYKYLNLPEKCGHLVLLLTVMMVREAIHVLPSSEIGEWHMCSETINYTGNVGSVLPGYPTLIENYRTLIFNGDVDACVPYNDNEEWTSSLGFQVAEGWRAWYVDNQVAGYVTKYAFNDFTFITVKGAGHMVPQFKPKQAYAMFERYLNQEQF